MHWDNIIAALVIVLVLGGAIFYIVKSKKNGVKCIGCPDAKVCSGKCARCAGSCSGCQTSENKD